MKYGTYTALTTPEQVIRDAFNDEETGGFCWDLRGEDSKMASYFGLFRFEESRVNGFLTIVRILGAVGEQDGTAEQLDWASNMRSSMLSCIGIEEI